MKKFFLLGLFLAAGVSGLKAQTSLSHENNYFSTAKLSTKITNVSLVEVSANEHQNAGYVKTYEHWRKLRNNGIVLTALGAACITVGAVLVTADAVNADGNADGARALLGAMGIAGGITSVGGGVTMWAIGQNRINKLGGVSIRAKGKNLGLVYNF